MFFVKCWPRYKEIRCNWLQQIFCLNMLSTCYENPLTHGDTKSKIGKHVLKTVKIRSAKFEFCSWEKIQVTARSNIYPSPKHHQLQQIFPSTLVDFSLLSSRTDKFSDWKYLTKSFSTYFSASCSCSILSMLSLLNFCCLNRRFFSLTF